MTVSDAIATAVVEVESVSKTFGTGPSAFTALDDVSFKLTAGRSLALLGRSGSGKSTLLNLLGAVDRPTGGVVRIDGVDLSTLSESQLALFRRRRLGYVFQSFHLIPSLTVFDNVAIPWTLDRGLNSNRRQELMELLDRLGVADKVRRYPDELSGGQQQRVALARAVAHRPRLLLADEPTGNLDAHTGRVILELLTELRREFGTAVVMATHSAEAAETCDDRLVLSDGRIVSEAA